MTQLAKAVTRTARKRWFPKGVYCWIINIEPMRAISKRPHPPVNGTAARATKYLAGTSVINGLSTISKNRVELCRQGICVLSMLSPLQSIPGGGDSQNIHLAHWETESSYWHFENTSSHYDTSSPCVGKNCCRFGVTMRAVEISLWMLKRWHR